MIQKTKLDLLPSNNKDVRFANRRIILHHLLLQKSTTRSELSRETGLSASTVANLVSNLIEEGLVAELGLVDSQGGRPTSLLTLNAEAGACLGIDVAETYTHFEMFDLSLRNIAASEIALSPEQNQPSQIVSIIGQGVSNLLAQTKLPAKHVVGAGISIPGPFEHSTGVSVFAPNWGWRDVALQPMLEKEVHVPLYVDNPLKFNAIAEAWFGAGRKVNNLVTIVLGTGVGAGLVIDGQLYQGTSNTSGEWGHTTIVHGGRLCRCGNRGCIEAYIGAPGIVQTLYEIDPGSALYHPEDQGKTIQDIVAAAQQGDAAAQGVLVRTTDILGEGLANLVNILNPQLIVLGSWLARLIGPIILPELGQVVKRHALAQNFRATDIVLSELADDAVSLGAAALVLEDYLVNSKKSRPRVRSMKSSLGQ